MGSSSFGRIFGVLSVLDYGQPSTNVSNTGKYRGAILSYQSKVTVYRGNKSFGLRIQPGWASRKRATLNE